MMTSPMLEEGIHVHITSNKTEGSYVRITAKMMEQFGCVVDHEGAEYIVPAGSGYYPQTYYIAAALTGGTAIVKGVHSNSMQGDLKFIDVLKQMGCAVTEEREGICVSGPKDGEYCGVDVDMNDFSDQSMTLAAIAPFAKTTTVIKNIEHIRLQESDRIEAMVNELNNLGVDVKEGRDRIEISPANVKPGVVDTYNDHRMAMSFALIGLRVDGIIIDNYECCCKTFENYFEVLEKACAQ